MCARMQEEWGKEKEQERLPRRRVVHLQACHMCTVNEETFLVLTYISADLLNMGRERKEQGTCVT